MRSKAEPNERSRGPLGIRASVWLFVLGLLLLCSLLLSLFHSDVSGPAGKVAANSREDSTISRRPGPWPPDQKQPERVIRERAQPPAALSAEQARSLAQQLANDEAQVLFGFQPSWHEAPARLIQERWVWKDRRACGLGDMEATVSFGLDGSRQSVDVIFLDNRSERY